MRARALAMALGAVAVASCALSPTMERAAPVSSHCPEEGLPRTRSAPPDTLRLRWYRAVDERDRNLAGSWCETVGPPVLSLDPTASFPGWEPGGELRVLNWNVGVGAGDLVSFLAEETGVPCDGSSALRDVRPFVLLAQEAWRRADGLPPMERESLAPYTVEVDRMDESADVVEVAERCGLALVYVPSARNGPDTGSGPDEDKGNAVLSSVPLTAPIAFDLPFEAGRKVAVAATVRTPGGERLRVVSAHLDVASTLIRTLISGNQTRVRQARGLLDGLEKAERDGPLNVITVVGGDFNTWSGSESTLKLMRDRFPHSPAWDGLPTWRPLGLPVDHIFFRRGAFDHVSVEGYGRIDDPHGSDHFGRRLVVEYRTAAEPR